MRRILVLNYEFPPLGGGASPVSYELAKRLSETNSFDIDVVTTGYKGLPKYEISPEVGVSTPKSIWIIVVFPAPFGPSKPKISPSAIEKETSFVARNAPNVFVR